MCLASLLGLSAALHLYVGARIVPAVAGFAPALLLVVLPTPLVPMGLVARRFVKRRGADRLATAGLLFMGLGSSMLVLTHRGQIDGRAAAVMPHFGAPQLLRAKIDRVAGVLHGREALSDMAEVGADQKLPAWHIQHPFRPP